MKRQISATHRYLVKVYLPRGARAYISEASWRCLRYSSQELWRGTITPETKVDIL